MTDIVVAEGYAAVGYEYINVDDCWLEKERDLNGQLVPDRERFPYGMKSLSDYVIHCLLLFQCLSVAQIHYSALGSLPRLIMLFCDCA